MNMTQGANLFEVETFHYLFDDDTYFVMVTREGRPVSDEHIYEVNDPKDLNQALFHAAMVVSQLESQETYDVVTSAR
jgi:hypothetical protein